MFRDPESVTKAQFKGEPRTDFPAILDIKFAAPDPFQRIGFRTDPRVGVKAPDEYIRQCIPGAEGVAGRCRKAECPILVIARTRRRADVDLVQVISSRILKVGAELDRVLAMDPTK